MDLRRLLQDVLSELSSEVISFQIEVHSLITWVKSSGVFQDYRIFEDMHHGITMHLIRNLKVTLECLPNLHCSVSVSNREIETKICSLNEF